MWQPVPHYFHVQMVHVFPICPYKTASRRISNLREGARGGDRAGWSGTVDNRAIYTRKNKTRLK